MTRKRKSPPPTDDLSQPDAHKKQHIIADQDPATTSAVDEKVASSTDSIPDGSKDAHREGPDFQASGAPLSMALPKCLHHSQHNRPFTTLLSNIPVPRWLKECEHGK
jgi:hypothetical protein